MKPLNQKARSVLDKLIEAFEDPEKLVDTLARATLIPHNRFIVSLHGTGDARGCPCSLFSFLTPLRVAFLSSITTMPMDLGETEVNHFTAALLGHF